MPAAIWSANLKDDVSAVAGKMSTSLTALDKTASALFKSTAGNFKDFAAGLKAAGVSTMDATLAMSKYRQELISARREALGLQTVQKKGFGGGLFTAANATTVARGAYGAASTLAGGAMDLVTGIADRAVEAGKQLTEAVWHAASFRQNTLMGLSYMLKSEEKAREVFTFAQKMAIESPMKTEELVSTFKSFVTAHYSVNEAKVLTKAVADVRSLNLEKPEIAEHAAFVFSHILGAGRGTQRHLSMLQAGGMNQMDIIKSLSKMDVMQPQMTKYKGKSDMELSVYVRKLMSTNKVGSRTLMQAVINALEERSGSAVGTLAKQKGTETLTGVASTLKSAFWDLLESDAADFANSEGMKALMAFMNRLVDAISPFSERFKESGSVMLKAIKGVTDALFEGLNRIKTEDIEDFIKRVGEGAKSVISFIKEAWSWLDRLLHTGDIGDEIGDILFDAAKFIGAGIWQGLKSGSSIIEEREKAKAEKFQNKYGVSQGAIEVAAGMAGVDAKTMLKRFKAGAAARSEAGFKAPTGLAMEGDVSAAADYIQKVSAEQLLREQQAAYAAMQKVGTDAAMGMEEGARTELDSHSPSRTMARVGEDAAAGLVMGTEKGISASPIGRGIGDVTVNVNVGSLSGMGDPTAAANTIADITVERVVLALLERKALEG